MNGTSATTFEPDGTITRAMVVTILYRMSGEPPYLATPDSQTFLPDGTIPTP